ncbi:uncharacterized protein LOC128496924 [Spea bombifrons]|uniref:uncharacterized protein LOC128496924 n=1 Tax=Spea bombifrons TaxID=233779 RepID=UPI00234AE23A|nr:uncharacterized protein LOC128496924 [Spea bombifrons]
MERLLSENDPPPFWCHICKISCASALNLHTHFLGAKHKKVEESLRSYVYEEESKKEENEVENKELEQAAVPGETLMDLLNACRTTEPAVGLEHIYEYHTEGREGFCIYECRMCHCQTGVSNMFMHVVGAKHRIMYLSKYHPDMDIPSTFQVKTPARNKKLKDACEAVEKTFGRKQINVMKGSHAPRSFISGPEPFPAINYRPNNELQYIDFTADDFGVKKKDPEHKREATFRELKAAHEAKLQAR